MSGSTIDSLAFPSDHHSLALSRNAELMEHHKAGGIRIIAIAGASRSPFLPQVPTLKEGGVAFLG